MTTSNPNQTTASKKPTHFALQVSDGKDGDSFWTRIGSSWAHSHSQGFNIQIDVALLDGRITLRVPSDKK